MLTQLLVLAALVLAPASARERGQELADGGRVLVLGVPSGIGEETIQRCADLSWPHLEPTRVVVVLEAPPPDEDLRGEWERRWREGPEPAAPLRAARASFLAGDRLGAALALRRAGVSADAFPELVAGPVERVALELALSRGLDLASVVDPRDPYDALLARAHAAARDLALVSTRAQRGDPRWEAAAGDYDRGLARLVAGEADADEYRAFLARFGEDSRVAEVLALHDPADRPGRGARSLLEAIQDPDRQDAFRRLRSRLAAITVEGLGLELVAALRGRLARVATGVVFELTGADLVVVVDGRWKGLLEDELTGRGVRVVPSLPFGG